MSQYNTGKKTEIDKVKEDLARLKRHNAYVDKHWKVMNEIRWHLEIGEYDQAHEMFNELPDQDKIGLDLAPAKGGMLKTWARNVGIKGVDTPTGWNWWDGRLPEAAE